MAGESIKNEGRREEDSAGQELQLVMRWPPESLSRACIPSPHPLAQELHLLGHWP